MKKIIIGLAMVAILGLTLYPLVQYQANAVMEEKMMMQKLTETNVPVTLPLTKGYVDGFEVFYISTEASDKDLAEHLTKVTGARVAYTPVLAKAPSASLANIYAFKNGIAGSGPLGFQPNVADSQPGDAKYSPLWKVNMVEWKGVAARELKSEADILAAQAKNELTITPTNLVVNCPFIKWNGGQLQIRSDKTLTDESPYGGGQVLDINTVKMQVTFVAHRGFAPDGKTIYYIATDASVKELADALGVIFVEKTGKTLITAASSDLFVFTNGIKGTGPMGFQASIASTNVGNAFYSPLWRILATTWSDPSQAQFLTTHAEITSAGTSGRLTTEIAGVVVNCPFVATNESMMDDKMIDDMMHDQMMRYMSMKGDLTAPKDNAPFGGEHVGNYIVKTKQNVVRIIAKVDSKAMMMDKMDDKMMDDNMMKSKVLEGWLIDMQSGYKLSMGQFGEKNSLVFTQRMVNPWIYDLIIITEEPTDDTDPSPNMPVGGAQLAEPLGQ